MLKLDTHSIQMIAICAILISTIFLGYLEFKRLHFKLDTIGEHVRVIEDLCNIKAKDIDVNLLSKENFINSKELIKNIYKQDYQIFKKHNIIY